MSESDIKSRLTRVTSHLADRGLISPLTGSAISIRAGKYFIITSDSFNPYEIAEKDLLTANIADGMVISQEGGKSRYTMVHAQIYQKRDDVNVILFGTPLYSTLLSASNRLPQTDLFVEAWKELGAVNKITYAPEESSILSGRVAMEMQNSNAVLIENYGALVVSSDMISASYRFELLEKVSKMTVETGRLEIKPLNSRQKIGLS